MSTVAGGAWDPNQYSRFAAERARPFEDLLARVPREGVRRAVDLGCGTGEHTRTLALRWPGADMTGVDNSAAMIERAASLPPVPGLHFVLADIETWRPEAPLGFVGAFASLQWVGEHAALLARIAGYLAPGGLLAAQMPRNHGEPSHGAIAEVAAEPRWSMDLQGLLRDRPVAPPGWYQETLLSLGLEADVWETVYWHLLRGEDPVLEWVKGTALTPILARLPEGEERDAFLERLAERLRAAYPPKPHGTPFPFRRLFFIARKPT